MGHPLHQCVVYNLVSSIKQFVELGFYMTISLFVSISINPSPILF